ncbi:plasmid partitioning protein RepB C-terminal domain-containing protein [Paraburkholderia silvatlantica]|uniref:plasmid partitioning protein RepB C-terminal domain-containing protein n=1 Tax=Paraburkholderia silvatlantica TaxID=321895 RepID=UPI003753D25F
MSGVILGFVPEPLSVPLDDILPSYRPPHGITATRKFRQILSSIAEVGLIEPLSVNALDQQSRKYTLLDGHLRLMALRDLGHTAAMCLVATDDEAYTYNNRINRLATVQEHFMIRRAIERGVSPTRLAKALGVNVDQIAAKVTLLDGLCPEAITLLKDQQFSPSLTRILRKMKPTRQVECVELMLASNSITASYASALLLATPSDRLVGGKKPSRTTGMSEDQIEKMEREMGNLHGQYKLVEQTYGQDVLNLVLARGYLARLLENLSVSRYLSDHQPELLREFESILNIESLNE